MRIRVLAVLTMICVFISSLSVSVRADYNPFTDVSESDYFYDAVQWARENEVTSGTTDTTFSPYDTCTRGQVMTFLWRANGNPEPQNLNNPFVDVNEDKYYYKAVLWAVEQYITAGTTATSFSPNDPCSYSQVLTFLWRGNGGPGYDRVSELAMKYTGKYYENAVAWADLTGMLTGDDFNPTEKCPRADIVNYIYLAKNNSQNLAIKPVNIDSSMSDMTTSAERHELSEYHDFDYDSLISSNDQYKGQLVKISGTVGSVISTASEPYMNIYGKGDYRLNYKALYNPTTNEVYEYGENVEVYGTVNGTEKYADTVIPVISIDTITQFSVPCGIEIGHEYGPFTIYQYSTASTTNKLFAQSDITSFRIVKIGFSSLSNQENQYYMDCEFSGKCNRSFCQVVIQFLSSNGTVIGETTVSNSGTENENFSVAKSVGVDMNTIENTSRIRFASTTGDLANTPRKEDVSSNTTTSGSSTRPSTSNSNNSNTNRSSTSNSSNSSTSGSSRSQTGTRTSTYDDDPFCNTCGGTGDCPNYCSYGEVQCTSCYLGSCKRCGGEGYLLSYNGKKTICTSCDNGNCRRCGGHGYVECSKCHGTGSCPTCHGNR